MGCMIYFYFRGFGIVAGERAMSNPLNLNTLADYLPVEHKLPALTITKIRYVIFSIK